MDIDTQYFSQLLDNNFVMGAVIVISEIIAVIALYILLRKLTGFILNRINSSESLQKISAQVSTIARIVSMLLTIMLILSILAIIGINGYQLYLGTDIKEYTFGLINSIPSGFFKSLGIAFAKIVFMVFAARILIKYMRRFLDYAEDKAINFEQLRENDKSVAHFFHSLKKILSAAIILTVLYLSFKFSPLPEKIAENLLLVLKVYLVVSVGLLIVNAMAAMVDSLDELSRKYAESNDLLAFYDKLKSLIPVLRRTLEYIVYASVATIVLNMTQFVPGLTKYGPGVIQAIGVIFVARVASSLIGLVIDNTFLHERLSESELQKNRTIFPIIRSILNWIVYFVALVIVLKGIGFDPMPLLAGAGILSMVIGLGAQPLVHDIMSGFFIIFEGQFKVGDFIQVGKSKGTVENISLRVTAIRNPEGQLHIIKNGEMKEVINFSNEFVNAVVDVGLLPETDLDKAYAAIEAAGERLADSHESVLSGTQVLGVNDISGPEIVVRTLTKVKPGTHLAMQRELKRYLTKTLEDAGMGIPFATRQSAVVVTTA